MSPRMRLAGITPPRSAGIAVLLACALGLPTFAGTAGAAARRSHVRVKQHSSPTCPGARLPQVTVSPLPGTPEASPQTQISFLGVEASKLRSIHVIGSLTGVHAGRLRSYDSEAGASFLPNAPFQEGERVSVCATVLTGSGKRRVSTSFQVATEAHLRYQTPFEVAGTRGEAQAYHSVDLKPPLITISHRAGVQSAPGDLFATPVRGAGRTRGDDLRKLGPADLVPPAAESRLGHRRPPAAELRRPRGSDLVAGAHQHLRIRHGEDVVANSAYEPVARIKGANGLQADLHDVQLTPSGAAYITAYYPVRTAVPTPGGGGVLRTAVVLDSVVQEIDIRTGLAMWEWQSLGHVPFAESRLGAPKKRGSTIRLLPRRLAAAALQREPHDLRAQRLGYLCDRAAHGSDRLAAWNAQEQSAGGLQCPLWLA